MECNDPNCPIHGKLRPHGRKFTGIVTSTKMMKTVTVEWTWNSYIPKYERYETKKSKVKAHLPECMQVREGDRVVIQETRPLSKTKHFVVIKVLGRKEE